MRLPPKFVAAGFASLLMLAGGTAFAQGTTTAPAAPATPPPAAVAPAPAKPVAPAATMAKSSAKAEGAGKPALSGPVNINTASATDLDALPSIGPKRAAKIIGGRPYKTPDDLVTKKVISAGIYAKIKDKIVVN